MDFLKQILKNFHIHSINRINTIQLYKVDINKQHQQNQIILTKKHLNNLN